MDELKLIMQMMSEAAPHAKEMFVWWLLLDKVVQPAVVIGGVCAVVFLATRVIRELASLDHTMRCIREEFCSLARTVRGPNYHTSLYPDRDDVRKYASDIRAALQSKEN